MDLDVVFLDEDLGDFRTEFLDFNDVGHETAVVQVEHIQRSLITSVTFL